MPDLEPAGETTKFLPKKIPGDLRKNFEHFGIPKIFEIFLKVSGDFFLEGIF